MYHTWCTKRRRLQPAHCVWPRGDTPRPRPGTVAGGATLRRRSGAAASNAEETEAEWFYEDLQDLLEPTPKKDFLFIIGDWNAKLGSQETPGVTGRFGLGMWNEAGQRLRVLPRKCTGHSKHPLPTTQEKALHMDITRWSTPKSD